MARGTDRQREAQTRNDKIRRLRGLYTNTLSLFDNGGDQQIILRAIDGRLRWFGAEPETDRRERIHAFWRIDPRNLPKDMTEDQYGTLDSNLLKPWGGRDKEPQWARDLREAYTK